MTLFIRIQLYLLAIIKKLQNILATRMPGNLQ